MADRFDNAPPLADRLELSYEYLSNEVAEAAAIVPAELHPIGTEEDAGGFAQTAKALKEVTTKVEGHRKKEKEQILKDGRTVDAFFAELIDPVKTALERVMHEINQYQRRKLEAQRKREEEERNAAALFDEPAPAPVVVKEAGRIVANGVKATATRKWVYEITDLQAVPRHYLMVNDSAIKAAIAGGLHNIPGVRVFEEIKTSIR